MALPTSTENIDVAIGEKSTGIVVGRHNDLQGPLRSEVASAVVHIIALLAVSPTLDPHPQRRSEAHQVKTFPPKISSEVVPYLK